MADCVKCLVRWLPEVRSLGLSCDPESAELFDFTRASTLVRQKLDMFLSRIQVFTASMVTKLLLLALIICSPSTYSLPLPVTGVERTTFSGLDWLYFAAISTEEGFNHLVDPNKPDFRRGDDQLWQAMVKARNEDPGMTFTTSLMTSVSSNDGETSRVDSSLLVEKASSFARRNLRKDPEMVARLAKARAERMIELGRELSRKENKRVYRSVLHRYDAEKDPEGAKARIRHYSMRRKHKEDLNPALREKRLQKKKETHKKRLAALNRDKQAFENFRKRKNEISTSHIVKIREDPVKWKGRLTRFYETREARRAKKLEPASLPDLNLRTRTDGALE